MSDIKEPQKKAILVNAARTAGSADVRVTIYHVI